MEAKARRETLFKAQEEVRVRCAEQRRIEMQKIDEELAKRLELEERQRTQAEKE